MHETLKELIAGGPVVADGAWGTQLQAAGLGPGECPEAWNMSRADVVGAVASAYVEAGSDLLLTNTFGGNRFALEGHGLADREDDLNRAGAEISRAAAGDRARVFGSMGPSGRMLLAGDVTEVELLEAFSRQAAALAEGGVDGLVVETMADVAEACLAVRACVETGLPVVASFAFDAGAAKDRTMMGVTPEEAADAVLAAGADIVGANCGQGIEGYKPLCERLQAASGRPLWAKPNAGMPVVEHGATVYKTQAEAFAGLVPGLIDAGVALVGGCCGTDPGFIRAVCARLGRDVR